MTLSLRGFMFLSLLCAVLSGAVFLPGLPGDFIFDDIGNIVENFRLHLGSLNPVAVFDAAVSPQPGSATRIIPMLTFALDYYRGGGLDPATFKITNIAIHALTAWVLMWFLRDLLLVAGVAEMRARWASLGLGLAWALHPLQVSSVLYVVQRMQTLSTLFLLLSLWAYLRARLAQIEGRPGRTGWMLTGLLWALALASKEDAIMLPAYLLALELTILRFDAADPTVARRIRSCFGIATAIGLVLYLSIVVPRHWEWEAYPLRDFSTLERLLSQGRVLCLYLWQIVVPLPAHMPFYYDWLQPSRGLLQPGITLPALLLIAALLGLAWRLRHQRPLFALGVFLFFAGHFVTSNVIGLELAFEHRNHFPLIGVALAIGDLLAMLTGRIPMKGGITSVTAVVFLFGLAGASLWRSHAWRSGLSLAETSTRLAPDSVRAWNSLCVSWYELGGGPVPGNPNLDKAIGACSRAADLGTDSIASLMNVLTFKTLQGTVTSSDWEHYLGRLHRVPLKQENVYTMWVMINLFRKGVPFDEDKVLSAIDIICNRVEFKGFDYAAIGYFVLSHTKQPERAYPFFETAVKTARDPGFTGALVSDLRKGGRPDWADRLQAVAKSSIIP